MAQDPSAAARAGMGVVTGRGPGPDSGTGTDAPSGSGGGAWAPRLRPHLPYAAFGLLALLVMLPFCVELPWAGDQGLHAAVVERLRHDLADPGNPLVAEDTPSPYYSPWMLLLGAVARLTGWDTFTVLSLAAVAATAALVTGVHRFVRTLTARPWAPVLALPAVVLLWGWELFAWSGWISFTSLTLTVAYPSTFALGLTLHLWAWLRREGDAGWRFAPCVLLGLLAGVVVLVHQFTGAVALVGAAAVAVCAPATRSPRAVRNLAAGAAALAVLLVLWPYYDVWRLAGAEGDLTAIHRNLYRDLPARNGLALLALPALAARARHTRGLDPLVLVFAVCGALFAAGGLLGHWSWGRVWPGVMLAAQLALAVELASMRPGALRRAAGAATAAALAVGAWTQAGAAVFVLPQARHAADRLGVQQVPLFGDYRWITPYLRYGDVVLTEDYHALRIAPAYGATTVAPAYPDFFLPDERQRWKDTADFFARGTTAAREREILIRRHVRWIVTSSSEAPVPKGRVFTTVATGPQGERLVRVDLRALRAGEH
ncbi:hypothetical protein [Streptomyces sp. NPDC001380]|uniref:hypothetical protein n=1 Tax=Streptomyces sp. NPDC001380 TaxID=3364566 RepID=UPI0036CB4916